MKAWEPDYRNVVMAARNVEAPRVPLYEHLIAETTMEKILGREFLAYHAGDLADKIADCFGGGVERRKTV